MRVSLRAAIAVALLVGFYVLAFGLIGALLTLETYALINRPFAGLKLLLFVVPVVYALIKGLISLERRTQDEVPGILVTPAEQPALWNLVRRLAAEVGTRPPDEIRILAAVNAVAGGGADSRVVFRGREPLSLHSLAALVRGPLDPLNLTSTYAVQ